MVSLLDETIFKYFLPNNPQPPLYPDMVLILLQMRGVPDEQDNRSGLYRL